MPEDEVAPVIKALVESGVEVGGVHNHRCTKSRENVFCFIGAGNAELLAKGLKAPLDQTGK